MNNNQRKPRTSLLACALIAVFIAGCGGNSAQDHLTKAKELSAKSDHRGAIIELKNALQVGNGLPEARYLLGKELLGQGDARAAEIELQKAYEQKYDVDQVMPLLLKSKLLQGQLDDVIRLALQAQLKTPEGNAEVQTLLGIAKFGKQKPDEAMTAFAQAKRFVPDYPSAMLGEARIKASQSDLASANTQIEKVLSNDPKQVEGLILRGDLARSTGKLKEAIPAYEAALKESPSNFIARLDLANALIADGQYDAGQTHIDELRKLSPKHPGVLYLDALVAFNKKDLSRASASISASLAAAPNNPAALLLGGAIATASNEPAQAEERLRDAVKLSPGNPYARKLLASLYLRQRQPQKADEILQPALAAKPDDPSLIGLAGEIALMKGDYNDASRAFDKVAKLNPSDGSIRTQSAAIQFAKGDAEAGFAELEAASRSNPNNANPDIALVLAHLQRREYDKAQVAWNTLQKRQPDSPLVYNLRAAIDMGKKDIPAARKSLEKAVQLQPTYFPAIANLASLDVADKNPDAARKRYRALLEKEPGNMSGLIALAQLEASNGGSQETIVGLLSEARRANQNSEQPTSALVAYYLSKNDPKQALAVVQQGLAASPNSPRYLDMIGTLQLQTGSTDQAIASFRKLVQVNPESMPSQIKLGQALLQSGQSEAALQTFANALKFRPNSIDAQAAMVGSLLRGNRVAEAGKLLSDIKLNSPKSPVIPELEGDVKLAGKQYADAAAIYKKVMATTPSTNLVIKNYSAISLSGKRAEADAFLADYVKAHPKDLQVRAFDADMALRARDFKRAAQSYRAVLEVQPNDVTVMNNLAWALSQDKDPSALALAEKASSLAPENPSISDTYGWMLVEQGQVKRGLELLKQANAKAPQQRDIALHLAKAEMKNGTKDAAKVVLESLVKNAPDSPEGKESKELLATL